MLFYVYSQLAYFQEQSQDSKRLIMVVQLPDPTVSETPRAPKPLNPKPSSKVGGKKEP